MSAHDHQARLQAALDHQARLQAALDEIAGERCTIDWCRITRVAHSYHWRWDSPDDCGAYGYAATPDEAIAAACRTLRAALGVMVVAPAPEVDFA